MKKFILYTLLFLWIGSVCAGAFIYTKAHKFLRTSPETGAMAHDVVIEIKPGMGFNQVAELLKENNIITDVLSFKFLALYLEADKNIQAGKFEFNTGWRPQEVLDHLMLGEAIFYRLTIREGLPWWEVARLLEEEGYAEYEDFKKVIHDKKFLAHWGIPFANAEGFLYPDTYFLPKPKELDEKAAQAIAGRLIDTFWRKTEQTWKDLGNKNRPTKEQLTRYLSLASIVEKETGKKDERARVAGVYTNRIKANMRLQADPTVAYGEGENFKPPLLNRHLDNEKNPYNTYRKAGLPPGPICSPSLASIQAAINPEQHKFYYFVAKGTDGSHYFSRNLNEHNNNVRKYRKTQK